MPELPIRPAREDELDALARVWHDAWRDSHAALLPAELVRRRTLESFRERLHAALDRLRVAGPAGAPLGFALTRGDELHQLFLAAEARGTGVAAALLADAERILASRGVRTAWLACAIGNDRAARFYEKQGWTRTGVMINDAETSEGVLPLETWRYEKRLAPSLAGRVAIVTGASRGGGRGIAQELGAAGAVVYVTGRSRPGEAPPEYADALPAFGLDALPGTIDETAAEVTRLGGEGVAVRVDHRNEREVAALVARVERERGRIDLLVNNAWGGHQSPLPKGPFWEQSLEHWDDMFEGGVRNHVVMSRAAAPLMIRQGGGGLIVTTTFWDRDRWMGVFFYDLAKAAMTRLAFGMAQDLRPHGVASVALSPGWMRTELVVGHMGADAERWQEVPALARTESPRYAGRGVVALAADPGVMAKTGGVYRVGDLAREYGFTDVDGRVVPAFEIEG